jgi:small conductance mechanosensitive channel
LLAGAGVIGIAIGFGAQTLVKDIITGLFILVEDHISVGDVVKFGDHAGTVEKLTLRTIQLRDVGGTVHVVPFSAVTTIENMTKGFSRYVFNVGVAYREDTDHVVDVLRELGEEFLQDERYKPFILEPLEILGVDSFGDNAVNIKARIKTVPIKQWSIGREFNRRIKIRFDELGIEIPFPHRTIYFGEDLSGNAPPARIATLDHTAYQEEQKKKQEHQDEAASQRQSKFALKHETGGPDVPDGD